MKRSFQVAAGLVFQLALCTAAIAADPVSSAGAGYRIHPGDQLAIAVYGEPALTQIVTVSADATIACPMIGRIKIGGQTPAEASALLTNAFRKYLREPIVSVGVAAQGDLTIMVLGNVKNPGKYTLPFNSLLTEAIAVAGGMGPTNGELPTVRVSDAESVRDASLEAILRDGVEKDDIVLHNNAVVYIPSPVTFNVEVVGAVAQPGEIAISQGDRLSTAIAKAGASNKSSADLNGIRVTRDLGNGQTKTFYVNLYTKLERGETGADLELQKNDVVFVPEAKKGNSVVTTILGLLGL